MVIDQNEMIENGMINVDEYTQMIQNANKFQEKLINFLKEYAMNYDPNFAAINYKGEKSVNGQTLKVYELKLTDESFKKLINYSVDSLTQNEKVEELVSAECYSGC